MLLHVVAISYVFHIITMVSATVVPCMTCIIYSGSSYIVLFCSLSAIFNRHTVRYINNNLLYKKHIQMFFTYLCKDITLLELL